MVSEGQDKLFLKLKIKQTFVYLPFLVSKLELYILGAVIVKKLRKYIRMYWNECYRKTKPDCGKGTYDISVCVKYILILINCKINLRSKESFITIFLSKITRNIVPKLKKKITRLSQDSNTCIPAFTHNEVHTGNSKNSKIHMHILVLR